jgi:hypothetical protein
VGVTSAIYRYLSPPTAIYRKRPFANYHRLSKIQSPSRCRHGQPQCLRHDRASSPLDVRDTAFARLRLIQRPIDHRLANLLFFLSTTETT